MFGVHIHFCGNGGWRFRSYSGSLSKSAKVTKALLPLHSVPRLGSACPHSGIAPGARRDRPSMAVRGYLGIHAEIAPCATPAFGLWERGRQIKIQSQSKARAKPEQSQSKARAKASRAGSLPQWLGVQLRFSPLNRPSVSSPAALDLDAPPPREAERRFCAVGNPAWMPG